MRCSFELYRFLVNNNYSLWVNRVVGNFPHILRSYKQFYIVALDLFTVVLNHTINPIHKIHNLFSFSHMNYWRWFGCFHLALYLNSWGVIDHTLFLFDWSLCISYFHHHNFEGQGLWYWFGGWGSWPHHRRTLQR